MDTLAVIPVLAAPQPPPVSIFQTEWWLDAVSDGNWTKIAAERSPDYRAWLPIYSYRRFGCQMIGMPPFTSMLGPVVITPPSAAHRSKLLRELIENLPPYTRFAQVFAARPEDAFVFALNGFDVGVQYTQTLAPAFDEIQAWNRLTGKRRNLVRKGQGLFKVDARIPPEVFYDFLNQNLERLGRRNKLERPVFLRAAAAATARDAFACLFAIGGDGRPVAGVALVWDDGRLYYLLSTRDADLATNAGVTVLIWEAIALATRKRLVLDFDSYGTPAAATFLGAFGGQVEARYTIAGASPLGRVLTSAQSLWRSLNPNGRLRAGTNL